MGCGAALHCGEVALWRPPDSSFNLLGSEVNTNFRMESLTRLPGHSLLVSVRIFEDWPAAPSGFSDCGTHPLKGLLKQLQVIAVLPDHS